MPVLSTEEEIERAMKRKASKLAAGIKKAVEELDNELNIELETRENLLDIFVSYLNDAAQNIVNSKYFS